MTPKEAEHELIELGLTWNSGGWWEAPGGMPAVVDSFVQEHPDTAVEWMREEMRQRATVSN